MITEIGTYLYAPANPCCADTCPCGYEKTVLGFRRGKTHSIGICLKVLKGSAAEVDQRQIDILRKLSFAERVDQGCSISDTARKVLAYHIRQETP